MEGPSTRATRTPSPPHQAAQLPDITDTSTPPVDIGNILATSSSTTKGPSEGILTLHDDPSAVADICFVHGLMGDRVGTWTAEGESEPWPKALLPALLGKVRILTYGYNGGVLSNSPRTGQSPADRAANNLLIDLTMERIAGNASSRPLILVAHSLGGIICKRAVLMSYDNANSHLQGVYMSLKAIMFIGNPHKGLKTSGWASIFTSLLGISAIPKDYHLSDLDSHSMLPEVTQERFKALIEDQRDRDRPIVTQSFFEETLAGKIGLTISKESATLPGNELIPINTSHKDMVRFNSVHDAGYQKIANVLQLWISESEDIRNTQPQADGSNNDSLQTGRSLNRDRLSRRMFIFPPSVRAPVQRPPSPLEIADVPTERPSRFRPCYIMCSIMVLVVIGSGGLGIYYTVQFDRMGDGFTAASWIVAIGAMALAGPMARHYPHCSCWRPKTPYYHAMHRTSTLPVS
ncbi:P-loop containing protein [Fusarium sp. NRRL 25303]|nr:P-loop containing protein [Fusarium sp. NRRL 25303]